MSKLITNFIVATVVSVMLGYFIGLGLYTNGFNPDMYRTPVFALATLSGVVIMGYLTAGDVVSATDSSTDQEITRG